MLGTFAVYYAEPRTPTACDLEAIAFITQTAALAIERHRSDRALRESQAALRCLNEQLERDVTARMQELDRAWRVSQDRLGRDPLRPPAGKGLGRGLTKLGLVLV